MLKIIEIGQFERDWCKDKKTRPGVELQSDGYASKAEVEDDEGEPTAEGVRHEVHVRLYVWREQLHLCLDHLKKYVQEMIDGSRSGLWEIRKQAAMRTGYVNTTFEEARRMGLI